MIKFPDHPSLSEGDLPVVEDFSSFHPFIKGVFSQWHPTPFEVDGVNFTCAEQYMMAAKAMLFDDLDIATKIMASDDPALHKRLGAQVRGFDHETWNR